MFGPNMAPSLTLVLLSLLFCVRAREQPTTVETLSTDCSLKLNELWALYTTPASYPEGCDGACLMACKETLEDAIYSETAVECPAQTEIVRCFGVYPDQWNEYVSKCELFSYSGAGAEAEADADVESESASTDAEAEAGTDAEAEAAVEGSEPEAAESEAESEAPDAEDSEAEAEAPEVEESEAEAEAPEVEESEAEAEAPEVEESEADATTGRRLMASEGESESEGGYGVGAGSGCFPDFASAQDFEKYISGQYWSEMSTASNTPGIVMSVAFWTGLTGMGFFMRH